jgi:hypothetical protein
VVEVLSNGKVFSQLQVSTARHVGSLRLAVMRIFTSQQSADATNQGLGGGREPVVKHLPSHHWSHNSSFIIYVANFLYLEQFYHISKNYSILLGAVVYTYNLSNMRSMGRMIKVRGWFPGQKT